MQEVLSKIKELTGQNYAQLTERGNKSIKIVFDLAQKLDKKKVLIPDQGGWITYKQYPPKFGLEIVEVKTDFGLLDMNDLVTKADETSILVCCSMPGYIAVDNFQEIVKQCSSLGCLVVNDASGTLGTDYAKMGDIIIGSFGKWKPVNLEYGGFIATNNLEMYTEFDESYFDEHKYEDLMEKFNTLPAKLEVYGSTRKQIIEDLQSFDIIHKDKEGINVCIKYKDDEVKQRIIDYCKENKIEYTECPRYIRVNTDAISIEIKRI